MTDYVIPLYPLMLEAERAIKLGSDTLDVLIDLEWGRDDACPSCGGHPGNVAPNVGHYKGCALRALIEEYLALYPSEEVEAA